MKLNFLCSKSPALQKLSPFRTPSAATRKVAAAIFILTSIIIVSWVVLESYRDYGGGDASDASESLAIQQALSYRLTILSVDEVTRIAQVKPQVVDETGKRDSLFRELHFKGFPPVLIGMSPIPSSSGVGILAQRMSVPQFSSGGGPTSMPTGSIPALSLPNLIGGAIPRLYFGPLLLRNLREQFELVGVAAFAFLIPEKEWPVSPKDSVVPATASTPKTVPIELPIQFTSEAPSGPPSELDISGDPELYPFDSYLLIGQVSCNIHALGDKNEFVNLDMFETDVDLRDPGFVVKHLSFADLQKLHPNLPKSYGMRLTVNDKNGNTIFSNDQYSDRWRDIASKNMARIFAVELRRPFFLRVFSVFLLVITVISMVYYSVVSNVKEFGLQALGYFFGLWAARQVLMSNGPKAFTAVDFAVFFLYSALVAVLVAKAIWPRKGGQPTP
jgi:hypothetical protein